ncbi:hypothetical protein CPC16_003297, partial [Podila verticillata]
MALFLGRLTPDTRSRDLEDLFAKYGRVTRLDIKRGTNSGFGFVEYEDPRDAEEAVHKLNRHVVNGSEIVVEFAKNNGRRAGDNECFKCGREGNYSQDDFNIRIVTGPATAVSPVVVTDVTAEGIVNSRISLCIRPPLVSASCHCPSGETEPAKILLPVLLERAPPSTPPCVREQDQEEPRSADLAIILNLEPRNVTDPNRNRLCARPKNDPHEDLPNSWKRETRTHGQPLPLWSRRRWPPPIFSSPPSPFAYCLPYVFEPYSRTPAVMFFVCANNKHTIGATVPVPVLPAVTVPAPALLAATAAMTATMAVTRVTTAVVAMAVRSVVEAMMLSAATTTAVAAVRRRTAAASTRLPVVAPPALLVTVVTSARTASAAPPTPSPATAR